MLLPPPMIGAEKLVHSYYDDSMTHVDKEEATVVSITTYDKRGNRIGNIIGKLKSKIKKAKVYVKDPSKVPAGKKVQTGPKGGHYYESGKGILSDVKKPSLPSIPPSVTEALFPGEKEEETDWLEIDFDDEEGYRLVEELYQEGLIDKKEYGSGRVAIKPEHFKIVEEELSSKGVGFSSPDANDYYASLGEKKKELKWYKPKVDKYAPEGASSADLDEFEEIHGVVNEPWSMKRLFEFYEVERGGASGRARKASWTMASPAVKDWAQQRGMGWSYLRDAYLYEPEVFDATIEEHESMDIDRPELWLHGKIKNWYEEGPSYDNPSTNELLQIAAEVFPSNKVRSYKDVRKGFQNEYDAIEEEKNHIEEEITRITGMSFDEFNDEIREMRALPEPLDSQIVTRWRTDKLNEMHHLREEHRKVNNKLEAAEGNLNLFSKDNYLGFVSNYNITQKVLKKKYPKGTITLFRGIDGGSYDRWEDDGMPSEDVMQLRSLSSWTYSPKVAHNFTGRKKGLVARAEIPIENIYTSCESNNIMIEQTSGYTEGEFVVMGWKGKAKLKDPDKFKNKYGDAFEVESPKKASEIVSELEESFAGNITSEEYQRIFEQHHNKEMGIPESTPHHEDTKLTSYPKFKKWKKEWIDNIIADGGDPSTIKNLSKEKLWKIYGLVAHGDKSKDRLKYIPTNNNNITKDLTTGENMLEPDEDEHNWIRDMRESECPPGYHYHPDHPKADPKTGCMKDEDMKKTGKFHKAFIKSINTTNRTFTLWASVDIRDRQGDRIPMEYLEQAMPAFMERGSPIIDNHSNRQVGKVLQYRFKDKMVDGKPIPGMEIDGCIFEGYTSDDDVWDRIINSDTEGASIGGNALYADIQCDDTGCERILGPIEIYEITIASPTAKIVNPEATISKFNNTEKSEESEIYFPVQNVLEMLAGGQDGQE